MAFSMHSHSGQFCPGHAKDQLEEVIQTAISHGFETFALTEHMPRNSLKDLYPEEIAANETCEPLFPRHEAFLVEAVRLQSLYASKIKLLIGFEGEWIRPSYAELIQDLASNPVVDYFIGSVHHVHEIPIDYDAAFYQKARDVAGGSDERLFEDYFDSQYEMLKALKPRVVGHFDLIRLLADDPSRDLKGMEGVWERVVRNLKLVVEQEGLLEINTSALRKGLKEPYPGKSVCEEYMRLGGRFTLSDDSHGIVQVGTNYERVWGYLEGLGIEELFVLEKKEGGEGLRVKGVKLEYIKERYKP